MTLTKPVEHPFIHHLVMITKKYLSNFADLTAEIPLERYHYALLYIYEQKERLTQQDLAEYFRVDKSFVVNMIDYLQKSGFVYRETSAEDRRKHFIKLTDKALEYIPKINVAYKESNDLGFTNISESDKKTFFDVIQQIASNLNNSEHIVTLDYKKSKV